MTARPVGGACRGPRRCRDAHLRSRPELSGASCGRCRRRRRRLAHQGASKTAGQIAGNSRAASRSSVGARPAMGRLRPRKRQPLCERGRATCAQGEVGGWVVAPIDVLTLSAIARDLSDRFETTAFIIDGDNHVLAHKRLLQPRPAKWQAEPTIPLAEFDDPVLARYAERVAARMTSAQRRRPMSKYRRSILGLDRTPRSAWHDGATTTSS